MSQIIEDLLRLARTSELECHRARCDITALAQEVTSALRTAHPGQHVGVTIAPEMLAAADSQLLRIVLENLIGNAWKFSAGSATPVIEIGEEASHEGRVFFVRDNGAGFDMAYADKLFQPFQRLHKLAEYPGSGIGLSIVARIIGRHGGRIWAEGTPGQGAVFRFTLQPHAGVSAVTVVPARRELILHSRCRSAGDQAGCPHI